MKSHVTHVIVQDGVLDQGGSLTAQPQPYVLFQAIAEDIRSPRQALCRVLYIELGSSLVVWAATASMGIRSITVTCNATVHSVPEETQQGVLLSRAASQKIHDELLLPVLHALCQEEGLSPPSSLRTLPLEIKVLILQGLPVSILSLIITALVVM